jgi:hypothetical protein
MNVRVNRAETNRRQVACALCKGPVRQQDQVVWAQEEGHASPSDDHVWHKHCFDAYLEQGEEA